MPNTYTNKVQVTRGGQTETLIDLTADTITASALMQGYTAHDASGAPIVGTATGGSMVIRDEADSHGGIIRHITAGTVVTGTISITENGDYDVSSYADASVSVTPPQPSLQAKTNVAPTTSSQTITADAGYDGLSSVQINAMPSGTAGTPTASKGTVSNHSIAVTPSVTNTTGYITGGTKTGTSVSVSASELVSGTYTVDASGTHDVSNYASVSVAAGSATASATKGTVSNHSVAVTPTATRTAGYVTAGSSNGTAVTVSASELVSGTLSITENGTADVTNYASVDVDVAGSSTAYTASITRVGSGTNPRVQVNGTGTTYRADGETFTFSEGDYLYFYIGASDYDRYVYVNGVLVSSGATYYTWYPPCYDVGIEFEQTNNARIVRITTPTLSITQNGSYDVADYAAASVAVPLPMTETDLKNYIMRSSSFTDIDWPDGLTSIGDNAFYNCNGFNPQSLPDGIVSIGTGAFNGCSSFQPASLPNSVTTIGSSAFNNCSKLALTSLPAGVTTIGTNAFAGCTKLALTSLPAGVTTINATAFTNCKMLALSSLPNGVTSIGGNAFQGCSSLTLTSLPSSITSISASAFQSCGGIASIACNGVITTLGSSAFTGTSSAPMSIASASFPNMALTANLGTAFGSTTAANACQLLETCDIGSTTGIATNAFANCYKLQTLVLRKTASVCTLANVSAFLNTPMRGYNGLTGTVYVPSALINSYKAASNWSTLYNDGTVTFSAIEGSDYEL